MSAETNKCDCATMKRLNSALIVEVRNSIDDVRWVAAILVMAMFNFLWTECPINPPRVPANTAL